MLTKNCKKFLKFLHHHKPDFQGRCYSYAFLEKEYPDSIENVFMVVRYLEKNGYLEVFTLNNTRFGVVLTEAGAHPYQIKFEELKAFLMKSVLVPIGVSIATTLLTLLLQSLL